MSSTVPIMLNVLQGNVHRIKTILCICYRWHANSRLNLINNDIVEIRIWMNTYKRLTICSSIVSRYNDGVAFHSLCMDKVPSCYGLMISCNGSVFHITEPFGREIDRSSVDYTHKAPVMRITDVFFVVSPKKLLDKQSNYQCFETLWHSWDVTVMRYVVQLPWLLPDLPLIAPLAPHPN